MKKILIIDNYDSFTYNLVHYVRELSNAQVNVRRNDQLSVEEAAAYDGILISPGPGIPDEAGISKEVIKTYAPTHRILGVCLGHQAIGEVFGAGLVNLDTVYHGLATTMEKTDEDEALFRGLPGRFEAGRYHSWIVDSNNLPAELKVTAVDENGQIMAMRHKSYDVRGVQFHPESVLTPRGKEMIKNWLSE